MENENSENVTKETINNSQNGNKLEQSKKRKLRKWIVLAFLVVAIIIGYETYRGNYLETLELGEQYLSIFWQNLSYQIATFAINFVI